MQFRCYGSVSINVMQDVMDTKFVMYNLVNTNFV